MFDDEHLLRCSHSEEAGTAEEHQYKMQIAELHSEENYQKNDSGYALQYGGNQSRLVFIRQITAKEIADDHAKSGKSHI